MKQITKQSLFSSLLLIVSSGSALAQSVEGIVGQLRYSAEELAVTQLYRLDDTMQKNYAKTKRMVGYSVTPVILALFNRNGGEYILYRNGEKVAVEPVPALYKQIKSVSHTVVGIFEIIAPYLDNPKSNAWKPELIEFNSQLKAGHAALVDIEMSKEAQQRCRIILEAGIKFTDKVLKTGTFSSDEYRQYVSSVWPLINENVMLAAKLQVDNFEQVLKTWRKNMGEEEWSRLYAVVNTAWAMRKGNVHFQILEQMMTSETVRDHLVLAESIKNVTEDDLLMLLGRVINDRDLAVNAFGIDHKYRMDEELMGEAAKAELNKSSTPHHIKQ